MKKCVWLGNREMIQQMRAVWSTRSISQSQPCRKIDTNLAWARRLYHWMVSNRTSSFRRLSQLQRIIHINYLLVVARQNILACTDQKQPKQWSENTLTFIALQPTTFDNCNYRYRQFLIHRISKWIKMMMQVIKDSMAVNKLSHPASMSIISC